ncbi:hypothetical protein H6S82_11830 [Planktothrix sp. FACHB-1355]|uniref:Uncharacterized protein n=1 Tax=Aerosakkonema funiforme FACHB-1375 TaxID=2949571 RepID=A0A926ZGL6_9CYAN|nr:MULTISPECIES: hypothetical protein [Oscillatoriales]MBD2179946.1 hypothetical protein [Aerosakkonema funiforme FACHB-1375]MBD3559548.1 hypothetical protein [Planktothrix sp. FACHB-1355]
MSTEKVTKVKNALGKVIHITTKEMFRSLFFPGYIIYEVLLDSQKPENIDSRLARLEQIKQDLKEAISAVDSLQSEAQQRKGEVEKLRAAIKKLEEDKNNVENILQVSEESFARLLSRANSKGRIRGWIDGLIVGFVSGVISSLVAGYIGNVLNPPTKTPSAPILDNQTSPSAPPKTNSKTPVNQK